MERTMNALAYGIAKRHDMLRNSLSTGIAGMNTLQSLRCDVVFGSPSVGCRGTGICKLNANGVAQALVMKQTCRGASALLVPINGGEGVSMIIPREFLCINIIRNHFRHNVLQMNEPCPIPKGFINTLGLKIKDLAPGTYPVKEMDGLYRIDFK